MISPDEYNENLESIRKTVQEFRAKSEADDEWLKKVYDRRIAQFSSDNGRIWSTGSILIPVSIAPFVGLSALESPKNALVCILAVASIGAYLFWLIIAQNHKAFQNKSMMWIKVVEEEVGLPDKFQGKAAKGWSDKFLVKDGAIHHSRLGFLIVLAAAWAVVLWLQFAGKLFPAMG